MRAYIKPEIKLVEFKTNELFADGFSDIFGTGNDIPLSVYTFGDYTSI